MTWLGPRFGIALSARGTRPLPSHPDSPYSGIQKLRLPFIAFQLLLA
jgi:hypothetical protein